MLGHSPGGERLPRRVAIIAGLLLAASAINYMDRQTLANASKRVVEEFGLTNAQYGRIEQSFGLAFAAGSLFFGLLADVVSVRWLYPTALLAWSLVGFATGFARDYDDLLGYRTALGFFEAAHWPCALKTTQLLLTARGRALGNGILQSGTSIGSIVTPVIMWWIMVRQGQSWRLGFQLVGLVGIAWIVAWLAATRTDDFPVSGGGRGREPREPDGIGPDIDTIRRWSAVIVVVVVINTVWQILRAWIPLILQNQYGYGETATLWYNAAWYAVADVGCLAAGWLAWRLGEAGWSVKWSRTLTAGLCCVPCLTLLAVPWIGAGPLLLGVLLAAGAGMLGLFPIYYSFTQDISRRRQGFVTGFTSFLGWVASALYQHQFGKVADATGSYTVGLAAAGGVTIVALLAWAILWPADRPRVDVEVEAPA